MDAEERVKEMEFYKMPSQAQYIRIKRFDEIETYFIICDEFDIVGRLKEKLSNVMDRPMASIRLYKGRKLLDDEASCHDQNVINDGVVHCAFKNLENEEWEEPPKDPAEVNMGKTQDTFLSATPTT